MKFQLKHGLSVGTDNYTEVEIGPVTAFLIQDAREAAEKPVNTPDGYKLLVSDARVGVEILRRRIKRIGDIQGPLSEKELRRLHEEDMQLISDKCEQMDEAQELPTDPRMGAEPAAD